MVLLKWLVCQLVFFTAFSHAFTDYLLKKCAQSGFCHRNRVYAENIAKSHHCYYKVDAESIAHDPLENVLHATIIKTIPRLEGDDIAVQFPFSLSFLQDHSVRFTINEKERMPTNSSGLLISSQRFNETWKYAFDKKFQEEANRTSIPQFHFLKQKQTVNSFWSKISSFLSLSNSTADTFHLRNGDVSVEIFAEPFQLKVYWQNALKLIVNEQNFLNIEHHRTKQENFAHVLPEETTFNMFKDNFLYSKHDSMPLGPESVALDFSFMGSTNVYGIPEHATSLRLMDTSGGKEPYRLFNVDVFEYNIGTSQPMYGSIPFMFSSSSTSIFWVNAADTWVDIKYDTSKNKTMTHWISENGVIDVVMSLGPDIPTIIDKFTDLTGRPFLPPISSIGYHQCRWNYNDEMDVLTVDSQMDAHMIPYDFIWLDLEYTNDKKYFTWKQHSFPNPKRLLSKLKKLGRNLVVLIDPHLKKDYEISDRVINENVAVKDHNGNDYVGHCWPGNSIWIDTISKYGQKIWKSFFERFMDLPADLTNLFIWNDMNEPSIFDGPETTAPKDLIHDNYIEERSVHNIYGLSVHEATYDAIKSIYSPSDKRPFLLTRAFFAGSQRTAATWTGDNVANWDYLKISIPMVLSNNIAGMPFIGADIAGFAEDPTPELIARWYQAGLWYPFFRAHAHIDTKRREPYLFNEPLKSIVRDTIQLRYFLLPTLYTMFHKSSVTGFPIMNPMFIEHPEFAELYHIDNQFYWSNSGLLVKPVTEPGQSETEMVFPPGIFYEFASLHSFINNGTGLIEKNISAPLDKIPLFIEGGHIITMKDKYRRSSMLMKNDPYIIVIAPDTEGRAVGDLYVDDGETFGYQRGEYVETQFIFENNTLKNVRSHIPENLTGIHHNTLRNTNIEKIIIAKNNLQHNITLKDSIKVKKNGEESSLPTRSSYENDNKITILNLSLDITEDWEVIF
ncbi:BAD_collapsed_G0004260.mRNA.1.CDS.1 [Saccharomyces cerevisiae]|nr:BAD_HP_G0039050.mRNA.1.CDS.1 [Saccharomyces cerevisiae]CAI6702426.1 BAD_HP_G0039050.mRNA.1.CDS.1 [Saccharomyces cerevisiae]CAI7156755.1 BAD_collapsed_G0004260.mRNA.1.CDS.1 [Saccharomyces cerevisiae]